MITYKHHIESHSIKKLVEEGEYDEAISHINSIIDDDFPYDLKTFQLIYSVYFSINQLFDYFVDVLNYDVCKNCESYIYYPISNNNFHILKKLFEKGVSINQLTINNIITPLAYYNSIYYVKLFLEQGLSINYQDERDNTFLVYAVYYDKLDLLVFLIENGIDVNKTNKYGKNVLFYFNNIVDINKKKKMLFYLMDAGVDIYQKDNKNKTAYESIEDVYKEIIDKAIRRQKIKQIL